MSKWETVTHGKQFNDYSMRTNRSCSFSFSVVIATHGRREIWRRDMIDTKSLGLIIQSRNIKFNEKHVNLYRFVVNWIWFNARWDLRAKFMIDCPPCVGGIKKYDAIKRNAVKLISDNSLNSSCENFQRFSLLSIIDMTPAPHQIHPQWFAQERLRFLPRNLSLNNRE